MNFNYAKIDAALSSAIASGSDPITLFITTASIPDATAAATLKQMGVNNPDGKTTVFTASLSQNDIKALSNQPWVRALRGSTQSRPCCQK